MTVFSEDGPELTFPDAETAVLREAYMGARVILEYGSGGSTVLAAQMPDKLIFSVESDRLWALRLQNWIDFQDLPSGATLFHADIGETGAWGRPVDESSWTRFIDYPNAIWDQTFFRHPDVVLIDGRFRAASMITVLMRITRPVTVLFDDYVERRPYHVVEDYLEPARIVGRMAIFDAVPGLIAVNDSAALFRALTQVTVAGRKGYYSVSAPDAIALRHQDRA